MGNGRPHDHPLTDIINHRIRTFSETAGLEYTTLCDAVAGYMPGGVYAWGVITLGKFHDFVLAMAAGNFAETSVSGTIKDFAFSDYDGNALFTMRIEDASGRTRTVG